MFKETGKLWNDESKIIISNNLSYYVLNELKDDVYTSCWRVLDSEGREKAEDNNTYTIKPIYEVGEDNNKVLVDYIIRKDKKKL